MPDPHVHVGRDGWLFLVGGRNRPLALYERSPARFWKLYRWEALIRQRRRRCERMGCRYLHLAIPEKLSVYGDLAAGLALDPARSFIRSLGRRLRGEGAYLEITGPLTDARALFETYYRTDTHWTSEGCRVAHDAVCAALHAPLRWSLADRPLTSLDLVGDLGGKLVPPRGETQHRREVARDARRIEANALVLRFEAGTLGPNLQTCSRVAFRNDAPDADPRRLLVFGDSFAHFISDALTGMLAETFREVHFVWSAGIDWSLVAQVRPDVVVTEMAERFMTVLPRDGIDFEAAAMAKLARFDEAQRRSAES